MLYSSNLTKFKKMNDVEISKFDKVIIIMRIVPSDIDELMTLHPDVSHSYILSPSKTLLTAYKYSMMIWKNYVFNYRNEKSSDNQYISEIYIIRNMLLDDKNILILCACSNYDRCHRSLVVEDVIVDTDIQHEEI